MTIDPEWIRLEERNFDDGTTTPLWTARSSVKGLRAAGGRFAGDTVIRTDMGESIIVGSPDEIAEKCQFIIRATQPVFDPDLLDKYAQTGGSE